MTNSAIKGKLCERLEHSGSTSLISCVETSIVIGNSRSKLINVLRAAGSSPADDQNAWIYGKHGGNGDAFLPACMKRRVGCLTETASVTSCILAALAVFN